MQVRCLNSCQKRGKSLIWEEIVTFLWTKEVLDLWCFLSKTLPFVSGNNMIGLFRLLPITSTDCSRHMGVTHGGAREALQCNFSNTHYFCIKHFLHNLLHYWVFNFLFCNLSCQNRELHQLCEQFSVALHWYSSVDPEWLLWLHCGWKLETSYGQEKSSWLNKESKICLFYILVTNFLLSRLWAFFL